MVARFFLSHVVSLACTVGLALSGAACGDDSDLMDVTASRDGGDLSDVLPDSSSGDAPGLDASVSDDAATDDAASPDAPAPCDLTDNLPDDCYEVPPLTPENAQLRTRVQGNNKLSTCYASRSDYTFDAVCIAEPAVVFPSGAWRNVIFDEGKIMSIKVVDPTMFQPLVTVKYDSASWDGVGVNGIYDLSVSRIPGDFSDDLPEACIVREHHDPRIRIENAAHPVSEDACGVDATATHYINVRLVRCAIGTTPYERCSATFWSSGSNSLWD
jgi:hypothetical protein